METSKFEANKFNPLTPNDHYSGRTAPLPSKRCILYIYSTNTGTEYFKHGIYSPLNVELLWLKPNLTRRGRFYQHIGVGIEEEACEVLHLEHSFIWC